MWQFLRNDGMQCYSLSMDREGKAKVWSPLAVDPLQLMSVPSIDNRNID
jgi:hypothetical protein